MYFTALFLALHYIIIKMQQTRVGISGLTPTWFTGDIPSVPYEKRRFFHVVRMGLEMILVKCFECDRKKVIT